MWDDEDESRWHAMVKQGPLLLQKCSIIVAQTERQEWRGAESMGLIPGRSRPATIDYGFPGILPLNPALFFPPQMEVYIIIQRSLKNALFYFD